MKELMSKTRKILVDTARQLFAQKGIDNTTMNNIALASGKGRRTLYTYFRSKTEVYQAVIESELSHLIHQLGDVVGRDGKSRRHGKISIGRNLSFWGGLSMTE